MTTIAAAPAATRIPARLADLNAAWLTRALRSTRTINAGTEVSGVRWTLMGEGEGFLGDLARVELEYEGGTGPQTAVFKIPTQKAENRGFGLLVGAYENEVRFYDELAPHVDVRMPRLYYAEMEPDGRAGRIVQRLLARLPDQVTLWLLDRLALAAGKSDRRAAVLMEDLGAARIGDQVAGATLADAEHAVEVLAHFHATFWRSPLLQRPWIVRQGDSPLITHGIYRRAWPTFEARFADRMDPATRRVLDVVTERGPDLLRRIGERTLTLVHGDFRMDNLVFFDGETPAAGMIDFQGVSAGHPLTDLAYFIRPNVDPEVADRAEDDLLRRYHSTLVECGVSDYPFETLESEYELAQLWVLHYGVILIGTLDLSHERGMRIVDRAIERALRVGGRLEPERWLD
jgi:hypothetical protein